MGPHCSFCGTFTGPFSEVEGLVAVLICIPCLEVRQTKPDTLLGLHDPGQPWEQWGCPIQGCGQWFIGPWDLEWHTAAKGVPAQQRFLTSAHPRRSVMFARQGCRAGTPKHPGWTATYELLRPYPNQRMRVVFRQQDHPELG